MILIMTVAKTQQNGSKAPAAKKPKSDVVTIPAQEASIDDRLDQVNELAAIGQQRAMLQEKRAKVKELMVNNEENNLELTIQGEDNSFFRTSNASVIKSQLENLEKQIIEKIDEIEIYILAFKM
jgi:hypothetical protein